MVLVSGGLDSATTLALAVDQGFSCYCLAVDYGQRHISELAASRKIADVIAGGAYKVVKLDLRTIGGSALTDDNIPVPESAQINNPSANHIPITYVPARNTIFLSIALGWAEVLGAHDIFIGVNAVDYSGYPDCRPQYIEAFTKLANLATRAGVGGEHFTIHTPLISLTKEEIIKSGLALGVDYSMTVSCYQATIDGKACGCCDSCRIRREGFSAVGCGDPTFYYS